MRTTCEKHVNNMHPNDVKVGGTVPFIVIYQSLLLKKTWQNCCVLAARQNRFFAPIGNVSVSCRKTILFILLKVTLVCKVSNIY